MRLHPQALREGIELGGEPYALKGARTVRKGVHYTGFLPCQVTS